MEISQYKNQEDYLKEIAEQISSGKEFRIENLTRKDILKLKDFDYIVTSGAYFDVIIRKRYMIDTFLNIPVVMWYKGYEVGDTCMGMIPCTYDVEGVLEEVKGFKGK